MFTGSEQCSLTCYILGWVSVVFVFGAICEAIKTRLDVVCKFIEDHAKSGLNCFAGVADVKDLVNVVKGLALARDGTVGNASAAAAIAGGVVVGAAAAGDGDMET